MSGLATRTSPRKSPSKRARAGRTTLPQKQKVTRKGRSGKNKVSATTAGKDKRASKAVKTREVAARPAAEKGGQPTVLDVDVGVDTVAKNKTRVGGGKTKTPQESSVEPVKTPQVVAPTVGVNKKKRVGVVKRKETPSKRNVVVTLPRQLDDDDESEYDESEYEEDENEGDEHDDDENEDNGEDNKNEDDDEEDNDEDDDEDAVQESISDDGNNGDNGAHNNRAGGNNEHDSALSSESDNSSGERFDAIIWKAARDVAAEDKEREALNRSAQKGTANPPNKYSQASSLLKIGGDIPVRGMSKTESVRKRQKHVADRITQFVKLDVFRRIKFINSDAMFQKAFRLVIDFENVPRHMHLRFQMLYESAFNDALNTKRSSCEQAGKKIARKALAEFRERGEQFYTIEEFCKLRRATTERERRAFFWFFDTFLECVCGARYWRKAKVLMLVSGAVDEDGRRKLVTKSDEAFGLLLIDNYIDKWSTTLTNLLAQAETTTDAGTTTDKDADVETTTASDADMETTMAKDADAESDADTGNDNNNTFAKNDRMKKKKGQERLMGKYTANKSGHCKYGGWSREGTKRFNEFHELVQEDRASEQSQEMESQLLAFCRTQAGIITNGDTQHGQGSDNALDETDALPIEAAWDLDD